MNINDDTQMAKLGRQVVLLVLRARNDAFQAEVKEVEEVLAPREETITDLHIDAPAVETVEVIDRPSSVRRSRDKTAAEICREFVKSHHREGFRVADVMSEYPGTTTGAISQQLIRLANAGTLKRVKPGLYRTR